MSENSTDNANHQLQRWVVDLFNLPKTALVSPTEHDCGKGQTDPTATDIVVSLDGRPCQTFTIPKPLGDITRHDVKQMREVLESHVIKKHPILGHLLRLVGWSFGFSGLYIMFAVCPFCGQPGCPVGAGSTALVGGFFALCVQYWKTVTRFLNHQLLGRKGDKG